MNQHDLYAIESIDEIPSPAVIFFEDLIDSNIAKMIEIAGGVERLRPHCKTHKTEAITRKLLDRGIGKHKCATIAEAEMLAAAGVPDVFLAYNIVGPNVQRVVELQKRFPDLELSVTADHPVALVRMSEVFESHAVQVGVVMDLDTGLQRTGIASDEDAIQLYEMICSLPGIRAAGLHWYDGQHRQTDVDERTVAVESGIARLVRLRDQLMLNGFPVPRMVVGGTGSFPIHARHQEPGLELSPGTVILHDAGYRSIFPDLNFQPAAAVLTRVVSRPGPNRATFDLGSKAIAADPPAGNRCHLPRLPDAREVLQNEEHLVLEFDSGCELTPGDTFLAFPWHVCPTSALYDEAIVVREGRIVDRWPITARNRRITI